MNQLSAVISELSRVLPAVMRWSGEVAKQLRRFDISVEGKLSGNPNTDALTLADLTVQELLIAALRDADPILKRCRIEGEESTGDMKHFAEDSELAITIDPIDGTKQFRDHSGDGYSVIVHLHDETTPHYSLVYSPEMGDTGIWTEVSEARIVCGPDERSRTARAVLDDLPDLRDGRNESGSGVYVIGFQEQDPARARDVDAVGLTGRTSDEMQGSIYPLMATGQYTGSLIHTPNIYDFPVAMHMARVLGGDAIRVDTREPVRYEGLWLDERAGMVRFPGIVACSASRAVLERLCDLASDWNRERYPQNTPAE